MTITELETQMERLRGEANWLRVQAAQKDREADELKKRHAELSTENLPLFNEQPTKENV